MTEKTSSKFFISIVLPSFLAIILFVLSFYLGLIPMVENRMMDRKKEMILELTNTAWSVLDEYHAEYGSGELSLEEAKQKAILQIGQMRYGSERKDYFWLIDHAPTMIMHPYRKDLNNKDLADYMDSHKNRLFVDAVSVVDSLGEGFVEYYWQWKDDDTRDVPKLSFVKAFEPWGWILGTGIYLEDVKAEITEMKRRLLAISGGIAGIIILALTYMIRQSLAIERKRREAEQGLKLSHQKYKSLVEASTEGTLMFLEGKVIFANQKFVEKYVPSGRVLGLGFHELFNADIGQFTQTMDEADRTLNLETQIIDEGNESEVLLSISKVSYSGSPGYIVVVKNVSPQRQMEISGKKLSDEVEFSLQLMHQSIEPFVREAVYCEIDATIQEALASMMKRGQGVIFIRNKERVVGVVNREDLVSRVMAKGLSYQEPISSVMTAPVLGIFSEALMYEATLRFKNKEVSHLLVKDETGKEVGVLAYQDCLEVQHNSLSYLIQQISSSESIRQLKELYSQMPLLISALVSSSDNINHITRLITTVSDSISVRIIQMGVDQLGQPPCAFAFVAMGSAGRSEQTLKTDQDNALIYEDGREGVEAYFLKLAEFINNSLNTVGYNNCKGLIMARFPQWCKPLKDWKGYFTQWIEEQGIENILNSKIFFDLKCIYGQESLVQDLRTHFNHLAKDNSLFLAQMADSIIRYRTGFENSIIDLKKVMLPIISYLRIRALHMGIDETHSMKRLYGLYEKEALSFERCEEIEKSYEFLMHQRIRIHARQLMNNETPENEVHKDMLTSIEVSVIEKILKQIQGLQQELGLAFKGD